MKDADHRAYRSVQPAPHVVEIFRVKEGCESLVRFLSPSYGGFMTHWVMKANKKPGSVYCDPNGCRSDWHKHEQFWRGYAAVEHLDQVRNLWLPDVLEISPSLELDLRDVYARGTVWRVRTPRKVKGKQGASTGTLEGKIPPEQLPPAFDYRTTVMRVFNNFGIAFDVPSPCPPRLRLEASPAIAGDFTPVAKPAPVSADKPTEQDWERLTAWRKKHASSGSAAGKNGTA